MKYPLEDGVCFLFFLCICKCEICREAQCFVLCAALALMALCYYETQWCCNEDNTHMKCVCSCFLSWPKWFRFVPRVPPSLNKNLHEARQCSRVALARHDGLQKSRRDLVPDSLFLQQLRHNGQLALKCQARMNLRRTPLMDPLAPLSDSLVPKAAQGIRRGLRCRFPPLQ